MNIEKFLKIEGERVYLKKNNGGWKKFDNIVKGVLEKCKLKLKKRKFRIRGVLAIGGCFMGKDNDEVWIYAKMPLAEQEKALIHEIIHVHSMDEILERAAKFSTGRAASDLNESSIEEMVEIIWLNKDYQNLIGDFLEK